MLQPFKTYWLSPDFVRHIKPGKMAESVEHWSHKWEIVGSNRRSSQTNEL